MIARMAGSSTSSASPNIMMPSAIAPTTSRMLNTVECGVLECPSVETRCVSGEKLRSKGLLVLLL